MPGRAAERIVGEVAAHHRLRRNQPGERDAVPLHLGLVVEEEESLVLLDGPANRAAELIQIEFFASSEAK